MIKRIPASAPGSYHQPSALPKMPALTLDRRSIPGVVQHTGKRLKPLLHLRPVDGDHAQSLGAAVQLAGVLGGDNDAVRHHPDLYRHPVGKSRLRYPLAA